MEKAEILGLKTQEDEEKVDTRTLDEMIENTEKHSHAIEVALSQEAARIAGGQYDMDFVYNIPRWSPGGKSDWGILCEKMPSGCTLKGTPHVHTLGINITGALEIMNTYMGLDVEVSEPKIETFTFLDKGKAMSKAYWTTSVKIFNNKTDTKLNVPYQAPVMMATGQGEKYNEYGSLICATKGLRKAILMSVPTNLQKEWIDAYKGISQKAKPTANTTTKKAPAEEKKPEPELTPAEAMSHITTITNSIHLTNWFTKYNAWFSTLKAEDRERVLAVFNAKQEELSKQGVTEETKDEPADQPQVKPEDKILLTGSQLDAITKIAKSKDMTAEFIKEMIGQMFGVDKVSELSKEQATKLIGELQKEAK